MNGRKRLRTTTALGYTFVGISLLFSSTANSQSLDELHKLALKEGGTLNCYCTLAVVNAQKIWPEFEKRFPGMKINHVDLTADQLAARAVTEARGGRTIGDVVQGSLENVIQIFEQKLLLEKLPPEAAAYPAELKGSYWLTNNMVFIIAAWNTNLVQKADEPGSFEAFADAKWKGKLMAEPRDLELLLGLARYKYNNDEKAIELLKKIAANNVEFHKGHSELAQFLLAGQGAACLTCYSHHFPAQIKKGAPLSFLLAEGIGTINATAVFKDAPHPNTAWLFARWAATEEGQAVYAKGGRTPAHPKVEPVEKIRPVKIYPIGVAEIKDWKKYEKLWKDIFKLR
jgi:iron(III) transport system substrate-binding protein